MTPERRQTVKRLFHAALDQAPEGRAASLEQACAALRDEVESLLSSHGQAGSFIEALGTLGLAPASELPR